MVGLITWLDGNQLTERKMEMNWKKEKPTVPGAYWVRGFTFPDSGGKALVEVENHAGELWSNLHESNSIRFADKYSGWTALTDTADHFEWCGPLLPSNPR